MGTYLNTSLYQPDLSFGQSLQTGYGDFGSSLLTQSSFSSPSIFQSQYGCAPMAPQQNGVSTSDDIMGLMMGVLLTLLLQRLSGPTETSYEETIIDDTDFDDARITPNKTAAAAPAAAPAKKDNTAGRVAAGLATGGLSEVFGGW